MKGAGSPLTDVLNPHLCLRLIVRMTFLLSFNSLNTPYRCGTNTVEDGIKNISSILSKTVLTLYKIRV